MSAAAGRLKSTVMFFATFVLAIGSVSFAVPQLFDSVAHADAITISSVDQLRYAVEHQADGQIWTINSGEYGLDRFNDISPEGQTGWYLPITANNLTINGVGNPTLFGNEYSANGNWSSQNLVSVFGDNVTIRGLTLMPKVDPNKTLEVLGSNFTLEDTTITPNTKVATSVYDNIGVASDKAFAKQWGGSIYFSHNGNHLLKNVTVNNAGISFRYAPSGTHITFDNVNIINHTNDDITNGYRYSSGFTNSGNSNTGAPHVTYNVDATLGNLNSAVTGAQNGDVVNFNSNLSIPQQLTLTKELTINGNNKTLSPTFTMTDSSLNSVIGIHSNNVTINNLVVDGTGGGNLHGINAYAATGIQLNDVTTKNNGRNGLVVNGSNVTVNNLTTSGNSWGGVDVDQGSGVTTPAVLTINGHSIHDEVGADVLVDNINKPNVTVNDTNNQYSYTIYGIMGVYKLKLATPTNLTPVDGTYTNNPAFVNTWTNVAGATGYEYRTANTMNGNVLGPIIYSDSSATQSGRYSTSGSTVTRQNGGAPQGTYYWQVRATGASGRVSDWSQINKVVVDTAAPSAPTLSDPSNNGFVTTNDFYFRWTQPSDSSPISYEFQSSSVSDVDNTGSLKNAWNSITNGNGEQNNLTTPQIHSTGAPNGVYYWQVRAIDAAGNKSAWTTPWKMTIDSQNPVMTITSPTPNQVVSSRSVAIRGTAVDTNFNYYYCYVSNVNGHEYGSRDASCNTTWHAVASDSLLGTITLPDNLPDGNYVVHLIGKDKAGNSTEVTQPFVLDTTAPVVTIDPAENISNNTPTVTGPVATTNGTTPVATVVTPQPADNNFGAPAVLGTQTTDAAQTPAADTQGTPEVKGASDQLATVAPEPNSTGMAWYWWVLIAAAAISFIWWLIARRRGSSES